MPHVRVNRKALARLRGGHLWIYRSDLVEVEAAGGDLVDVTDRGGQRVGCAFYSDQSQIALRLLARGDARVDAGELGRRIRAAMALRQRVYGDSIDALRLVHGEADGLPGFVVDRYGPVLVVQTAIQASDRRLDWLVDWLADALDPAAIVERNDIGSRRHEGLEERAGIVYGALDDLVTIREDQVALAVDPLRGQKTGMFLDQRGNHLAAGRLVREGDRCLDVFTYDGGFALQMARAGGQVTAVDVSAEALQRGADNARRNDLTVDWIEANAFDWLNQAVVEGRRYHVVVLDPPAFARSKRALPGARRGYKEINLRAIQLLEPGGWLVSCSCSHNLSSDAFVDLIRDAAGDAGRRLQIVERRRAGRDHPELLGVPETGYLKCYILRALG